MKLAFAAVTLLTAATSSPAAIIPSWRVNPITPSAITSSGGLLNNAVSVSLMVELTGGSLLSGGGIDLTYRPDLRFYQWRRFGDDALDPPTPDDISQFPNAAFDTLSRVNIIGPLSGGGPALRANTDLHPTSGDDRTGRLLNIAWGTTAVGGAGLLEVLRFTVFQADLGMTEPIPLQYGFVRDSQGAIIGLPPAPFGFPEPGAAIAATGTLAIVTRRRSRNR